MLRCELLFLDLNHSNSMVQHISSIIVKKAQEVNKSLTSAHWSDGCGEQLKNRNQLYWITVAKFPIKVAHNFFQSCHSKGPSDSEGAVVKSFLRRLVFVCDLRANDSKDAYNFCVGEEGRALRERHLRGEKRRHNISREFHYISAGVVDYLKKLN